MRRMSIGCVTLTHGAGFSLVSVLAATAIAAVLGAVLVSTQLQFTFRLSNKKIDDGGLLALGHSVAQLRDADFGDLVQYCKTKGVLRLTGAQPGNENGCLDGGALIQTPSTNASDRQFGLEAPLDSLGDPGQGLNIRVCLAVTCCRVLGQGHLIEVALTERSFYPSDRRIVNRTRRFRRSRW